MKNSGKIEYAFNTETEGWATIDWEKANRKVKLLQRRIVKAWQEGKHRKAKSLQWILTHSYSAKVLAVRRVTENSGKRTPGVDGKTWSTPESKWNASKTLSRKGYKASPLRRVHIPKSNGKKRPLGIPTMKDRAMQALYLMALDPISETTADKYSFGFRLHRSCADAIAQSFNVLARKDTAQWILEGDIKGCFDNIDHKWILKNIPLDKKMLRQWLNSGVIEGGKLFPTQKGTPQGGIISPVIANMVLDGLENVINDAVGITYDKNGKKRGTACKVNFIRYADDFIVTGVTSELLKEIVQPTIEQFLKDRGLSLSKEKTRITHINEGFDFLGQNLRKYKEKLLIKPSKSSIKSVKQKVRKIIRDNPTMKTFNLIKRLNPVIRGWANYHRHIVSQKVFSRVDHEIFIATWNWAARRHNKKGKKWVKAKYFKKVGNRNWVFMDMLNGEKAELIRADRTAIIRHVVIKRGANPYDPVWESYFEKRIDRTMTNSLKGRNFLTSLWKSQKGNCPICNEKITLTTKWHNHHIIPKYLGGKYTLKNLVMLHPDCHRKVHFLNLKVVKPCYV